MTNIGDLFYRYFTGRHFVPWQIRRSCVASRRTFASHVLLQCANEKIEHVLVLPLCGMCSGRQVCSMTYAHILVGQTDVWRYALPMTVLQYLPAVPKASFAAVPNAG